MGDAFDGDDKKPSGCGLLVLYNIVFRHHPSPPRRSSSASSVSATATPFGSAPAKLSHSNSKRRRAVSDNESLLVPKPAADNMHLARSPMNNGIAPSAANVKGAAAAPGRRGQGMPASLVRMQSNGLTAELDSIINDHQRSKGSNTLVRASSGNVMLFGNLGNLRAPGAVTANRNILQNNSLANANTNNIEAKVLFPVSNDKPKEEEVPSEMPRALSRRFEPEELKEIGDEEYKNGRYVEAIALYDRAIVMSPQVASYYSNKAAALIGLGQLLEAVIECKEAVKIDPSYARAHHRLATLYLRLGEAEKAIRHYKLSGSEASAMDISRAQDLKSHISKCNEARKVRDWKTMLQEAESAFSSGADAAPLVFASQAEALLRLHRHEEAESVLIDAPRFDNDASTKFYGAACNSYQLSIQAQVDMAAGRFEDAVTVSQRASRVDPSSREVCAVARKARTVASARGKGNDFFKASKYEDAFLAYEEGLNNDPENAILLCNRAACRSKLGQWEKAIEDCNAALSLRPSYSKARLRRADCFTKLGRWKDAVQDYEAVLRGVPGDEEVCKALCECQTQLKQQHGEETRGLTSNADIILIASMSQFRQKIALPGHSAVLFTLGSGDISKQVMASMEQLCQRYPSLDFFKVNVEESEDIANSECISTVPAFKVYRNGNCVKDIEGFDHEQIETFLSGVVS